MLARRSISIHRVEHLDHRGDAELELALATATQMTPDRIRALRIAGDDGSTSCWHRLTQLRCKEIWVMGAGRFRNPDADLPADFRRAAGGVLRAGWASPGNR